MTRGLPHSLNSENDDQCNHSIEIWKLYVLAVLQHYFSHTFYQSNKLKYSGYCELKNYTNFRNFSQLLQEKNPGNQSVL